MFSNTQNQWLNYDLWCIVFLVMPKYLFTKYFDMDFNSVKIQLQKHYLLPLKKEVVEKISNNIVKYINITKNLSAFEFLYSFINKYTSANLDYKVLQNIHWEHLENFNQPKIKCLHEITKSQSRDDVINNILPLLKDKETETFIFSIVEKIKLPNIFSPLYMYYLKNYKDEYNIENIKHLEETINNYITNSPINM